jgi:hypothetical protein
MTRSVAALLLVLTLSLSAEAQDPPGPGTNFRVCPRLPVHYGALRVCNNRMLRRSSVGTAPGDPAVWTTASGATVAYRRVWEGYFYLDTTNPAIWIDETSFSSSMFRGWEGTQEVIHRAPGRVTVAGALGQMAPFVFWPNDCMDHVDIVVSGPTASGPGLIRYVANRDSCAFPYDPGPPPPWPYLSNGGLGENTETNVFTHELGHAYGYAHFGGWLSNMNTAQGARPVGCELGTAGAGEVSMWTVPSAHTQQCHDLTYGVGTPSDLDMGVTPLFQESDCDLTMSDCTSTSAISNGHTPIDRAENWVLRYTTMMNRGAASDYVVVYTYLSRDRVVDGGDLIVDSYSAPAIEWTAGATIRRVRTITVQPGNLPVPNTPYYVLVRVDADGYFAETRETNNVTDLGISFYRR